MRFLKLSKMRPYSGLDVESAKLDINFFSFRLLDWISMLYNSHYVQLILSKYDFFIIYTGTLWVSYRDWYVQVLFCRLQVSELEDPIHTFFSVTKMYTFYFVYGTVNIE